MTGDPITESTRQGREITPTHAVREKLAAHRRALAAAAASLLQPRKRARASEPYPAAKTTTSRGAIATSSVTRAASYLIGTLATLERVPADATGEEIDAERLAELTELLAEANARVAELNARILWMRHAPFLRPGRTSS